MSEEKVESGNWCSWCFKQADMLLLEKNTFSRNLYRCKNCSRETNHCTICRIGMSKVQTEGGEKLCASCDKTVRNWGDKPRPLRSYCSWCFKLTDHNMLQLNYTSRDIYECENCHKQSTKCRLCAGKIENGMARGEDFLCFKCSRKITDWSKTEENLASLSKMRWCSWCIEPTRHELEDAGGIVGRGIYTCKSCGGPTSPCVMCKCAMTRVGDNWNEASCEVCDAPKKVINTITQKIGQLSTKDKEAPEEKEKEKENDVDQEEVKRSKWLQLNSQKKQILSSGYDITRAKMEMASTSPEREKAQKAGLIRPFLLLVSMHPGLRAQIAMLLGWSSIVRPSYGNSHQEAWEILDTDMKGMVSRANSTKQSINPLARNCTYYDMFQRVHEAVFHLGEPELPYSESIIASTTPNEKRIHTLEERFIDNVAESRRKNMTDEERKEFDLKKKRALSPELDAANAEVLERIAITNETTREYCKSLLEEAVSAPEEYIKQKVTQVLVSKHIIKAAKSAHGAASAIASAKSSPFHFVKMVVDGANIVFGATLEKLYGPLVILMSQRILLASHKCEVDEYYKAP